MIVGTIKPRMDDDCRMPKDFIGCCQSNKIVMSCLCALCSSSPPSHACPSKCPDKKKCLKQRTHRNRMKSFVADQIKVSLCKMCFIMIIIIIIKIYISFLICLIYILVLMSLKKIHISISFIINYIYFYYCTIPTKI